MIGVRIAIADALKFLTQDVVHIRIDILRLKQVCLILRLAIEI